MIGGEGEFNMKRIYFERSEQKFHAADIFLFTVSQFNVIERVVNSHIIHYSDVKNVQYTLLQAISSNPTHPCHGSDTKTWIWKNTIIHFRDPIFKKSDWTKEHHLKDINYHRHQPTLQYSGQIWLTSKEHRLIDNWHVRKHKLDRVLHCCEKCKTWTLWRQLAHSTSHENE